MWAIHWLRDCCDHGSPNHNHYQDDHDYYYSTNDQNYYNGLNDNDYYNGTND